MLEVLIQFRILFSSIRKHYKDVQSITGMGGAQLWALTYVGDNPGNTVGELATALAIHQSTASNLVSDLEKRGAISKQRLEGDRRTICLSITAKGRAIVKRAPRPLIGVLQQALQHLSPAELDALHAQLTRLIKFAARADKKARSTLISQL